MHEQNIPGLPVSTKLSKRGLRYIAGIKPPAHSNVVSSNLDLQRPETTTIKRQRKTGLLEVPAISKQHGLHSCRQLGYQVETSISSTQLYSLLWITYGLGALGTTCDVLTTKRPKKKFNLRFAARNAHGIRRQPRNSHRRMRVVSADLYTISREATNF